MQKVSMGDNVLRCSSCGHMSVIQKDARNPKCPLCKGAMSPVSENSQNDQSVKEATDPASV